MLGLAPALIVLVVITLAPAIYLVITSLTPLNLVNPESANDFSDPALNYREAWLDPSGVARKVTTEEAESHGVTSAGAVVKLVPALLA